MGPEPAPGGAVAEGRPYRAGLVAVVGKPNVGKSSLVNAVVGQKVSIVSDKAQTTRRRILGIATRPEWQIAFADTPGLHEPRHRLGAVLNETVLQSLSDVDAVLIMVDVSKRPGKEDRALAQALASRLGSPSPAPGEGERKSSGPPVVLCLNKMDLLPPAEVQANYDAYVELFATERVMMTSMTREQNLDRLLDLLVGLLPEGDPLYPEDEVTDLPMRDLASELVREKVLRLTRAEVPHAVAAYVESWEEPEEPGGAVHIGVVIMVETDGQKGILIGKKGQMLKRVGTEARLEIEEMTGQRVYLELFVKVRTDWRQNPRILSELGFV